MSTKYPQLADHLRKWGLKVHEVAGWQTRSARSTTFTPRAIVVHHTATTLGGNTPSLNIVTHGRTGVPGPLAQFLLARDGSVYVVSGGRANHAGLGGPRAGIPKDQGNQYAWGIEAENNGVGEKWQAPQLQAYYRLCAALLDLMGTEDVSKVIAHKEWAPTRKSDTAGIDLNAFRNEVKKAVALGTQPAVPLTPDGDRWLGLYNPMLVGNDVNGVRNVMRLLRNNIPATGPYDRQLSDLVGVFQKNRGIDERGVGPLTWAALRKVAHG